VTTRLEGLPEVPPEFRSHRKVIQDGKTSVKV
jgi:hypothetical protein